MSNCPSGFGGNYGEYCSLQDGHDGDHRGDYGTWPNTKPPRKRKLVTIVKIESEWPNGSVDLTDAINRLTLELPGFWTVVAGYEPRG